MLNLKKGAYRRLFLLLISLVLSCLLPVAAFAESACPADHLDEYARIRYVHDGDTVHLEDGRKVRLIGINTPELARDNLPAQAYAQAARAALIKAVSSHDDRVGLVYGEERHDRYQRTLAHLFSPDGDNFQAQLLQQGLAVAITHPPNDNYAACYASQEKTARCSGSGIWSHPDHAVVRAEDLTTANKGFHRVNGEVEHVSQSARGVWIFISELMISIHAENLVDFDPAELLSLESKTLTVRGWIHPASKKQAKKKSRNSRSVIYFMRIRHPSAIEINLADNETKC